MANNARSKGPTETRFSQSLQLNEILVSEAQVLLRGLRTPGLNAKIRGFFNHPAALTNPGQGAPQQDTPTTFGNYSPKHLFPGKGESLG